MRVYIAPAPVPQSWFRPGQPGWRVLLVSFLPSLGPSPRLLRVGRVIRASDFPSLLDEGLQKMTIEQDYHSSLHITSSIESRTGLFEVPESPERRKKEPF